MDKESFLKNKLTNMCNTYKAIATLSSLAVELNDFDTVEKQYIELKKIEKRIISIINIIFQKSSIQSIQKIEDLYSEAMPEYYTPLKTIIAYNKMLSLKYANLETQQPEKEFEQTIKCCKMSIDFNYNEDFAYINLCKALYNNKNYAEVIKLSEQIKAITDTAPVYEILGDTYRKLGDYGNAIENYHKYLERNEKDEDALKTLEEIYEEALN